ncbi:hypothetical protein [Flavisolibacter nicotianae]|uniref:hypothetical protein n=1 Tax=Flavisolibacter nicotianae TaxID=2364882 RepID=UPI000EAF7E6B|nr:hypothetical protein [Flavisolibacter nicotianae]
MNAENTSKTDREKRRREHRSFNNPSRQLSDNELTLQSQYALLKEAYIEMQKLQIENAALKEKLHQYECPDDGYRKDWTWVAKIVFILEKAERPLATKEIIERLEKREPTLKDHHDKGKFFSAFLNLALKHGRIQREKRKGERGYYYFIEQTRLLDKCNP